MGGFDWSDYFKLATRLSSEAGEASLRSAVSRSYYCIFHLALTRAENNNYVPAKQGSSHRDLWLLYDSSPVHECRALAAIGRRMKSWRVTADYDDQFPKLEETCQRVLVEAQRFATVLAKVDPRHPKR